MICDSPPVMSISDALMLEYFDRLSAGDARLATDFPAETERYVVDAEGYVLTMVGGEPVLENGEPTGALPGRVLRGC